ncbi:MAG: hypothetical protein QN179_08630 [Armatimonadota bacterium]|nr:hypothetical protein [Armatimonadota bacterium]
MKEGGTVQLMTREMLWRLFECTGSIWAYLAYRRCRPLGGVVILTVSLN